MNFNLWEYLKPKNTNTPQLDISQSIQPIQNDPALNDILYNRIKGGSVKDLNFVQAGFNNLKNKINLFDKIVQKTPDTIQTGTDENGNPILNSTISNPIQKNGFFNDIQRGFNENYNNGFKLNNLQGNKNKSIANRIGEGFGTLGRFMQSPFGRGLITAWLVELTGGGGLEALAYGGQAGMLNQQNRLNDTLYRNQLSSQGIDTNGIRGYINGDTYNQLLNAKQLQDNAEHRNAMLSMQKQNHEDMVNLAKDKFNYQKDRDKKEDYFKSRSLAIQEEKAKNRNLNSKTQNVINKNSGAIRKIDALISALKKSQNPNNPSYGATGFWQGAQNNSWQPVVQNLNNKSTSEQIQLRGQLADLGSTIVTDRAGTAQTANEMKRLKAFIPDVYDNPRVAIAKLEGMKENLKSETDFYLQGEGLSIQDFDEFNTSGSQNNSNNVTSGINIDYNAIDKELARRGLQ